MLCRGTSPNTCFAWPGWPGQETNSLVHLNTFSNSASYCKGKKHVDSGTPVRILMDGVFCLCYLLASRKRTINTGSITYEAGDTYFPRKYCAEGQRALVTHHGRPEMSIMDTAPIPATHYISHQQRQEAAEPLPHAQLPSVLTGFLTTGATSGSGAHLWTVPQG